MQFEPGERIGDLELVRELGRGGFAVVYLATDVRLRRPVALKVLSVSRLTGSTSAGERLLSEARKIASLRCPQVVTLYRLHDLGESGLGLEMEYMDGGSLAERLVPGLPVAPETATAYLRTLLEALEAAHAQGVLHRDVKPENLLFTARGDLKLADFGLGRGPGDASLTDPHAARVAGTPLYMAPEVIAGDPPTPAADLWSVGVIAYRLLVGHLPFEPAPLPALFYRILNEQPEPLGPEHPPILAALANRCLEKDPERRPVSASALLRELSGAPSALTRATRGAGARQAPPAPGPAPLGREGELERLDAALARAAGGAGTAVLLVGEAGSGKSTLLREAQRQARRQGMRWIEASLSPLGGLQRPLLLAARGVILEESVAGDLAAEITAQRFGGAAPLLRTLLTEGGSEALGRQQLVWAIESLLRGLSSERPSVLALEDLHLADADEFRSLAELVRRLENASVLVVATYRAHDAAASESGGGPLAGLAALSALPGLVTLELAPLADAPLARLVLREAGAERAHPEVQDRVRQESEGNPLFATELVRHLLAEHAVVLEGRRLVRGPQWAGVHLPGRLAELASTRLQRLLPEERDLLDAASVEGVAFDGALVAAVLEQPLLPVLRGLQRIARTHRLLLALPSGFRFAHAVFRDTVYAELAGDLRRHLHACLARVLEGPGQPARDAERLGLHWHGAGRRDLAAPYLRQAAHDAALRQQYLRALRLADRSGLLSEDAPSALWASEADLIFALAGCHSDLGEHAAAGALLDRLERVAGARGDEQLSARVEVWRSDVRFHEGGPAGLARPGLDAAARLLPPSVDRGRALYLLGRRERWAGNLDAARRLLGDADEEFERQRQPHLRAQVRFALGGLDKAAGRLRSAEEHYAASAREHAAGGRVTDAAVARVLLQLTRLDAGQRAGVERALREDVAVLERAGAEGRAAHVRVYLARALTAEGRLAEAALTLEAALERMRPLRLLGGLEEAYADLADVEISRGRWPQAEQALEQLVALGDDADDPDARLARLTIAVRLAAQRGDAEAYQRARAAVLSVPVVQAAVVSRLWAAWRVLEVERAPQRLQPLSAAGAPGALPESGSLLAFLWPADAPLTSELPACPSCGLPHPGRRAAEAEALHGLLLAGPAGPGPQRPAVRVLRERIDVLGAPWLERWAQEVLDPPAGAPPP